MSNGGNRLSCRESKSSIEGNLSSAIARDGSTGDPFPVTSCLGEGRGLGSGRDSFFASMTSLSDRPDSPVSPRLATSPSSPLNASPIVLGRPLIGEGDGLFKNDDIDVELLAKGAGLGRVFVVTLSGGSTILVPAFVVVVVLGLMVRGKMAGPSDGKDTMALAVLDGSKPLKEPILSFWLDMDGTWPRRVGCNGGMPEYVFVLFKSVERNGSEASIEGVLEGCLGGGAISYNG
jgi:hypothetical protein